MRLIELEKVFWDRMDATKCVSKMNCTEDEWKLALNTFDAFNALEEEDFRLDMFPLEKYLIPAPFKDFVLPSAVKFDVGNRLSLDLREHEQVGKAKVLSPDQLLNVLTAVLGAFKRVSFETKPLDELRRPQNVVDVLGRMSHDGMARYDGTAFIPLVMKKDVSFFKDVYYNVPVEDVVKDYATYSFVEALRG